MVIRKGGDGVNFLQWGQEEVALRLNLEAFAADLGVMKVQEHHESLKEHSVT